MQPIKFKATPNTSATHLKFDGVVLHLTMGSFDGAVEWLRTTPEERLRLHGLKSYSSAHVVFGRLGETTQLAKLDRMTWHSGVISNPSVRGKLAMKKKLFGWENPNKHMLGYEFAGGYDIDRDGIIESWEKLYSPQQIKQAVLVHLEFEKQMGRVIPDHKIITHSDITSYKPNLDIARSMFLAELEKQRNVATLPTPSVQVLPMESKTILVTGENLQVKIT